MWPPDQLMSKDKASDLLSLRTGHCGLCGLEFLTCAGWLMANITVLAKDSGGDRDTLRQLAQVPRHVRLGHAVGQFGGQHPARWWWCGCCRA
jgi:hypothetical protein